MRDTIGLHGHFQARVISRGRLVELIDEDNLIVNAGRLLIANALLGVGGLIGGSMGIGVGTSGTPPAVTDTTITGGYIRGTLGNSIVGTTVNVRWVIEESEANGVAIREFALYNDVTMIARKVRNAAIAKDANMRLEGVWSFGF